MVVLEEPKEPILKKDNLTSDGTLLFRIEDVKEVTMKSKEGKDFTSICLYGKPDRDDDIHRMFAFRSELRNLIRSSDFGKDTDNWNNKVIEIKVKILDNGFKRWLINPIAT